MAVAFRPVSGRVDARRFIAPVAALIGFAIIGLALGRTVPTWLDAHVKPWVDARYHWTVINRDTNWFFTLVSKPIAHLLSSSFGFIAWILRTLRWPGVLVSVFLIGWRTGGSKAAINGTLALAGCGVLGLWAHTMDTLALMVVAVVLSLLIGVPLGIWAGLNDKVDRRMKAVLDAAQVMPAYVYLLPIVVLFGIGTPPAIVATVVFAVVPAVRLTSLGVRSVPVVASEVGSAYGCTRRQLLTKVQLPMARRTILLGINQVIMMGFGVIVIAALVGTGGLGADVLTGLQKVDVGRSFVPGLALVLTAVALDRISTGERSSQRQRFSAPPSLRAFSEKLRTRREQATLFSALSIGVASIAAKLVNAKEFPTWLTLDLATPVNDAAAWANNHLRRGIPIIGGTGPISDFIVRHLLTPLRDLLLNMPWWAVIVVFAAIGWSSGGPKLAAVCILCLTAIAALRTWDLAMDTLSQVMVAVVISLLLAIPIGILSGRSDRVEAVLRPILDAAQVMPSFVYLVPVIFLFSVGRVPGVIASVIYALPPGIRLTSLGLRSVPAATREAAISFGATPRQELLKVQLPMAIRSVMLGVNQTIMMVLSMVIVAALVGAGALGIEAVSGLTRGEVGRGSAGGLSIVLLAVVLDRLTQAWGNRPEVGHR
jgi:glycine betaine/proline transport system permease protein